MALFSEFGLKSPLSAHPIEQIQNNITYTWNIQIIGEINKFLLNYVEVQKRHKKIYLMSEWFNRPTLEGRRTTTTRIPTFLIKSAIYQ
jgi:hypothetical protein